MALGRASYPKMRGEEGEWLQARGTGGSSHLRLLLFCVVRGQCDGQLSPPGQDTKGAEVRGLGLQGLEGPLGSRKGRCLTVPVLGDLSCVVSSARHRAKGLGCRAGCLAGFVQVWNASEEVQDVETGEPMAMPREAEAVSPVARAAKGSGDGGAHGQEDWVGVRRGQRQSWLGSYLRSRPARSVNPVGARVRSLSCDWPTPNRMNLRTPGDTSRVGLWSAASLSAGTKGESGAASWHRGHCDRRKGELFGGASARMGAVFSARFSLRSFCCKHCQEH